MLTYIPIAHEFDIVNFLAIYFFFFCNCCFKSLIAVAFLLPLCSVHDMVMVLICSLVIIYKTEIFADLLIHLKLKIYQFLTANI